MPGVPLEATHMCSHIVSGSGFRLAGPQWRNGLLPIPQADIGWGICPQESNPSQYQRDRHVRILIAPLSTITLPPCPDALLFPFSSPFLSIISRLLRNGVTRSRCPLGFGVPVSSCWAQGTCSTPFLGVTEPAAIYDKSCSCGFVSGNYREFLKYVFRPSESVIHGI